MPFKFLKSVDLKTIGRGLSGVSSGFGWNLFEWKPTVEQSGSEGDLGPDEIFTDEVVEVVEVSKEESMPENLLGLEGFRAGSEPVSDFSETRTESPLIFEDKLDDTFDKVVDIDMPEELKTPHETDPSIPIAKPQPGEGLRRKRIKTSAGQTDLPLVHEFLAMQSKSSSPSSRQRSVPPKPTRKSFRLASQGFHKKTSTSKQAPPLVEEIVPSPEGSPVRDSGTSSTKQATPAVRAGKAPAESSSSPTSKILETPSSRSSSKWKASPKQASKQGPIEGESSAGPKAKKAKSAAPTSSKLAQLLQRRVVRGKIVKISYFQEQGLTVFLDKLKAQGWLHLFTNTQMGCFVPKLAEFYANCMVTNGIVTSEVFGKKI